MAMQIKLIVVVVVEGRGGWMVNFFSRCPSIQYEFKNPSTCSCSILLSYLLSRSFTWKIYVEAWILVFESCYIWNKFSFFKSTLEANKCEERAVMWKWPPVLVTSLHWSHHVDQKALVTSLVCFRIALAIGSCRVAVDFFHEFKMSFFIR